MLRVGITGGIGSGKSTVARIFGAMGIPVYFADEETRRLMNTDPLIKQQLLDYFGPDTYNEAGLNRPFIAAQVFNDPDKLAVLNSITHPPTIAHADRWMDQFNGSTIPFTLKEAALFFESGSARSLDFIIGVWSPPELRITRIMDRDGIGREQVLQRIDRQLDEDIKMKLCDAVIINDETRMLIPQVLSLYESLKQKKPAGLH